MTQKEFTDRTGISPTEGEFDYIHALYMNTAMDKDEFCKDFKNHGASSIMREVHAVAVNYKLRLEEENSKSAELVDFLLGKAALHEDFDIYEQVINMIGRKEAIKRKIKNDLPLWEEDNLYIINNLK